MGGRGAPDDLQKGYKTQKWLAVSNDEKAKVSGRYLFHGKERACNPEAQDELLQEQFLKLCQEITGISLPRIRGLSTLGIYTPAGSNLKET
jgi:hypothetical protein